MNTTPTDAELEKLFVEETGFDIDDFPAAILDFARAVRARWGQPSGAGEPVVAFRHGCKWCGKTTGCEHAPQPTQSVPPAGREPLTQEQITAAAKKLAECMEYPWEFMPEPGRKNMRKHAQAVIEAAGGIKAKEAGNADA